ncbi:MAG TPA: histidine phosphatase family protein [Gaiellaceae bacterium]
MRLFIVRHAEAAAGEPDDLRPLTPGGRDAARAVGERLAAHTPDAVLTSPLLRARETGALIARACGLDAEADERLAPGADADAVVEAASGRGDTVVAVGHQPDCSEIVLALSGREVVFAPAAFAELEL